MKDKDITEHVSIGEIDGESLSLEKCVCGREFKSWDFVMSIYRDQANQCDCGRRLYFSNKVTVYEVIE